MLRLLAASIAIIFVAYGQTTPKQAFTSLEQANLSFNEGKYLDAGQKVMAIANSIWRSFPSSKSWMPTVDQIQKDVKPDRDSINVLFSKLRDSLHSNDATAALRTCFILSMSLKTIDSKNDSEMQVRERQASFTAAPTSGLWLIQAGDLIKAYWNAGSFGEAAALSEQLLVVAPKHKESSIFVHLAHTILGLHAIKSGDTVSASNHLLASVNSLKPDLALKSGQPNLGLAEALLQKGKSDIVLAYLEAVLKFDGWLMAKPHITAYRDKLSGHSLTTFGTVATLTF
jgi:hypothetical protein